MFAVELGTGARTWAQLTVSVDPGVDSIDLVTKIKQSAPNTHVRNGVNCGMDQCFQVLFFSPKDKGAQAKVKAVIKGAGGSVGRVAQYQQEQACFAAPDLISEQGRVALLFAGITADEVECGSGVCCFTTSTPSLSLEDDLLAVEGVTSVSSPVPRIPPPSQTNAAAEYIVEIFMEQVEEISQAQVERALMSAFASVSFAVQCHGPYFCTLVAEQAIFTSMADKLRTSLASARMVVSDPKPARGKIATVSFDTRKGRRGLATLLTPADMVAKYMLIASGVDVMDVHCIPKACTFTVPVWTSSLPTVAHIKHSLNTDIRSMLKELRVQAMPALSEDVTMLSAARIDDAAMAHDAADAAAVALGDAAVVARGVSCSPIDGICVFTTNHLAPNGNMKLVLTNATSDSVYGAAPHECVGNTTFQGVFHSHAGATLHTVEATAVLLQANLAPDSVACRDAACTFRVSPCMGMDALSALFRKLTTVPASTFLTEHWTHFHLFVPHAPLFGSNLPFEAAIALRCVVL